MHGPGILRATPAPDLKRRKMDEERGETAYHEAAHMVAAWEQGLSVLGATIVPDPEAGYAGRVITPIEEQVHYAYWTNERDYLYAHLVTRYAGVVASELYTNEPTPPEAIVVSLQSIGSDYYEIAGYILDLGGDEEQSQTDVGKAALRHATNLVSVQWSNISSIAHTLMERDTLDERECRQVLESTGIV
jgi:hypothetical protein